MNPSLSKCLWTAMLCLLGTRSLSAQLHPVLVEGKSGLINDEGEVVIEPQWDRLEPIARGVWLCELNHRVGLYQLGHGMVLSPEWDTWDRMTVNSTIRFKTDKKVAFATYSAEDSAYHVLSTDSLGNTFSGGRVVFYQQGRAGLMHIGRGQLLPPVYDQIESRGYFVMAKREGKAEVFNLNMRRVATPEIEDMHGLQPSYFVMKINGQWGAMDTNGRQLLPPLFSHVELETMNIWRVMRDDRVGLYTLEGRMILPAKYSWVNRLVNGWLVAFDGSSTGLYSQTGRFLCRMDDYQEYSLIGMASLKVTDLSGKSGVIDSTGKMALPCLYDDVQFNEGIFLVGSYAKGWQLVGDNGKVLSHSPIDGAGAFNNNAAIFVRGGREGLIRRDGKVLLEAVYEEVQRIGTVVRAKKGGKWTTHYFTDEGEPTDAPQIILDRDHYVGAEAPADTDEDDGDDMIVRERPRGWYQNRIGDWGLADNAGTRVLIKPQFDYVFPLNDQITLVEKEADGISRYGVVDQIQGRIMHPVGFREVRYYQNLNGVWPVQTGEGFWTLMNGRGKIKALGTVTYMRNWMNEDRIVACLGGKITYHKQKDLETITQRNKYDAYSKLNKDEYGKMEGGKWGIMNSKGNWVVQPQYDFISEFEKGVAVYRKGDKYGLLNEQGEPLTEALYAQVEYFKMKESIFVSMRLGGSLMGIIDSAGSWVIFPEWDETRDMLEGLAPVRKGAVWNYSDAQGHLLLDFPAKDAHPFREGWGRVHDGKGWTFVNAQGQLLSDQRFTRAGDFHDGMATVVFRGMNYYVNQQGMLSSSYREVSNFREGMAIVRDEKGYTVIDVQGTVLSRRRFHSLRWLNDSLLVAGDGKRTGVVTLGGEWLLRGQYGSLADGGEGLILVQQDQRYFWMNQEGKRVFWERWVNAKPFSGGVAAVRTSQGWSYISREGKTLEGYEPAKPIAARVNWAKHKQGWCRVNEQGKPLGALSILNEPRFVGGYAPASSVPYAALYSSSGEELIPARYERYEVDGKLIRAYMGGNWSYARNDGSWVWR